MATTTLQSSPLQPSILRDDASRPLAHEHVWVTFENGLADPTFDPPPTKNPPPGGVRGYQFHRLAPRARLTFMIEPDYRSAYMIDGFTVGLAVQAIFPSGPEDEMRRVSFFPTPGCVVSRREESLILDLSFESTASQQLDLKIHFKSRETGEILVFDPQVGNDGGN